MATTMTTMTMACRVPVSSICTDTYDAALSAQNACHSLRREKGTDHTIVTPDATKFKLSTRTPTMQLVDLSEDEKLFQPNDWPMEELMTHHFQTYGEVRRVLMKTPEFTDHLINELMEKVEKGLTLTPKERSTLIHKAWVIRYALHAMGQTLPSVIPTTTPYVASVSDSDLQDLVAATPEDSEFAQELHWKQRQEHARRQKNTLEMQNKDQLETMLMQATGEFPDLVVAIVDTLKKKREQEAASASAGAPPQDTPALGTPNKIPIIGKTFDPHTATQRSTKELRANSVKPQQAETFEVELIVDEDTTYKTLVSNVQETFPNSEFALRGPEEMTIEGKPMYKFTVFIQLMIANVGTQAQAILQQKVTAAMIKAGHTDALPARMMETYHQQLKNPETKTIRALPTVALPGRDAKPTSPRRHQEGGASGSATNVATHVTSSAAASAEPTKELEDRVLKMNMVELCKQELENLFELRIDVDFTIKTMVYSVDEIVHTVEEMKKMKNDNVWKEYPGESHNEMFLRVWITELRAVNKRRLSGKILRKRTPNDMPVTLVGAKNLSDDDAFWDNLDVPPMSDQDDVATLRVRPCCQNLKLMLMDFMKMYRLDGRAIRLCCTLNTKNYNYMINTFAPRNSNLDAVNPKFTTYVKRYLKNIVEEGEMQANIGPKWWQDPNPYVDQNLRPTQPPPRGLFGEMDDDNNIITCKREHSPNTEDERWAAFKVAMLDLQNDIKCDTYSMEDLRQLGRNCVDYHKKGVDDVDGQPGEGWYEEWDELKSKLSCINLVKCAKLAKMDEVLWGYWEQDLDDRHVRHLQACLGQEIDRLTDFTQYYNVTREELERHDKLRLKYWKMCPYNDPDGVCASRHSDECRYLHAKRH
jgi:hypothetical protein